RLQSEMKRKCQGNVIAFPWPGKRGDTHDKARHLSSGLSVVQEVLQVTPLSVNEVGLVFVPFHVPLKPGGDERVAPGAIAPLYDAFVIVTFAALWVKLPPHNWVIVCLG